MVATSLILLLILDAMLMDASTFSVTMNSGPSSGILFMFSVKHQLPLQGPGTANLPQETVVYAA